MDATSDSTSRSLIRRVVAGNSEAWDQFVSLYAPVVYGWARQSGLQESDARDICQNVFVSLVKNLGRFRHDEPGHSLRGWLRTITRNAVVDWARQRQTFVGEAALSADEWEQALALATAAEESVASDRVLVVRRALELVRSDFQPSTWQMFWQFQVDGQAAEDIARQRGVSVWSVYKANARILARLRELLSEFLSGW